MNWNSQMLITFLLFSFLFCLRTVAAGKYNISMAEMDTCKEYDIRGSGYSYADFFGVNKLDNNNIKSEERLHLKFYVMTSMDAHVLLSVNDHPRLSDRVYEVVIGAGGNSFSAIRNSMGRRRVATNQDPKILSLFDPTPIEIIQMKDGQLLVYIPGFKEEPLLNYTDPVPLNINFISFSVFGSISAKWFYDCKFDNFGNEIDQQLRVLTPRQRLLANVTANNGNKTIPMSLEEVTFTFQIAAVSYRQEASILSTRLDLFLYWSDERLVWQPAEFSGIRNIVSNEELELWIPKIVVLNGALDTFREFKPLWEYRLDSYGNVALRANNVELQSWCPNVAYNWPNDVLRCEIVLGLNELDAEHTAPLKLVYQKTEHPFDEQMGSGSEWQFIKMSVATIGNEVDTRLNERGVLRVMDGDVSIDFSIKRNSTFYKNVFSMPVLVCETLMILSFLLHGYRRGALLLLVLLVASMALMFITKHAPHYYIPNIMYAYQSILFLTAFCYWQHIGTIWLQLYPPKERPYPWIMSIVNFSPLRFILCLRFSGANEYVETQERPWNAISKVLTNISFIIVIISFAMCNVSLLL